MIEEGTNKIIAKNATMLYFRMFVTMAISFYTSRIVLKALGVSDYGIYNVVGGVIVMISTLTGALGGATSRFLTFALGKKDMENLKTTFSTAFYIHLTLAILFVVVAESVGVWFVNTQLVIPEGRMGAANWVFQAAILSTALGMTQTPYSASITSHERMGAFAYIAIANAVFKLSIAFIVLISAVDHLVLYSILLMILSISFRLYYRYYCIKNFEECRLRLIFDKDLFKRMLSFSSWSMLGSISHSVKEQGVNVLINRFFGTLLNAAAGVSLQVQGLLYAFTANITTAFNPQIIKSYAVSDYKRVNELIGLGAKFTALVTILTTIPLIFNMDFLMSLWLEEVPPGSVVICQTLLFGNFLNSFNPMINRAIIASGQIKYVNIYFCFYYMILLLFTYIALKITHYYVCPYLIGLFGCPLSTGIYMYLLKRVMPDFSIKRFLRTTYFPLVIIALLSFVLAAFITRIIDNKLLSFLIILVSCSLFVIIVVYYFVLDLKVKVQIKEYVKSMVKIAV